MRRPSKRRTRGCPRWSTCAEWSAAMDHIIYTTMTGAGAAAYRQTLLANNLPNLSTPRLLPPPPPAAARRGGAAPGRVFWGGAPAGAGEAAEGPVQHTGRNLDALAAGRAW